jgi:cellobiose phosphorylase
VEHTGDYAIFDESVKFIEGRLLNPGEDSCYELPGISEQAVSLYEHCVLAIRHGSHYGSHGLPLMGSGDWNDGMDKVGYEGKGESVWLAFFLFDVLTRFQALARSRKDVEFADSCNKESKQLRKNIEQHAWDGNWYLRAFFDDGTPLGSAKNEECKIDSIPQSWSVLSGGGQSARSRTAMKSAYEFLVKKDISIIRLFDPPFNLAVPNPGYIRGYLPGVRENGGQYTHAAIWLVMGAAALQDKQTTYDLISMINPLKHGDTAAGIKKYKTEPYVIAADVYAVEKREGMGGWTWYTGSAGWMYQMLAESFFGLKRKANRLTIKPCVPDDWHEWQIEYRFGETTYELQFKKNEGIKQFTLVLDNIEQESEDLLMVNDQQKHEVTINIPVFAETLNTVNS